MHDPEVVAFEIRSPIPHVHKRKARHGRWRWSPPFVNIAGRELYFPSLITIWHVEPHGEDALQGECRGTRWQWHVHHWHIQWCFLQKWQRRLLSRCAWCGGGHTKRDPLCIGTGGWHSKPTPLWKGETDIVHDDCHSVLHAHRLCMCTDPLVAGFHAGTCAICGKFHVANREPTIPDRYLASLPAGSRIPAAKRDWLKSEWAKVRAEREAS